jgi:hypothetical protein
VYIGNKEKKRELQPKLQMEKKIQKARSTMSNRMLRYNIKMGIKRNRIK